MLDLQVTEYQMKIQRVKDNIARHAQDTHKLQDEIEEQREEKSNKSVLLREMSQQMSPTATGDDQGPIEHWACPRCSNINELVARLCNTCGFVPQDIASLILVSD